MFTKYEEYALSIISGGESNPPKINGLFITELIDKGKFKRPIFIVCAEKNTAFVSSI